MSLQRRQWYENINNIKVDKQLDESKLLLESLQRRQWFENIQQTLLNETPLMTPPNIGGAYPKPWVAQPTEPTGGNTDEPVEPSWSKDIGETLDTFATDQIRENKPWYVPLWLAKEKTDYPIKPDEPMTVPEAEQWVAELIAWLWAQYNKEKD